MIHINHNCSEHSNIDRVRLEIGETNTLVGFPVKCPICCRILIKTGMYRQILAKLANIKFRKNAFSGVRFITCGQRDRQAGMTMGNSVLLRT